MKQSPPLPTVAPTRVPTVHSLPPSLAGATRGSVAPPLPPWRLLSPSAPRSARRRCGCPLWPRRTRCSTRPLAGAVASPPPCHPLLRAGRLGTGCASPPPPYCCPYPCPYCTLTHSLPSRCSSCGSSLTSPATQCGTPPAPAPLSPPPRLPPSRERPRGTPALSASREGRGA